MSKYDQMDNDELGNLLSDYHKDVYGFRPRYEGLYSDRTRMIEMLNGLDAHMERMKETFAGREQLREDGWFVEETDPELAKHAEWLAREREAARKQYEDFANEAYR